MERAFYLLLLVAQAEDTPTATPTAKKDDPINTALDFLTDDKVSAATKALQAIKDLVSTSKSSEVKIGERQSGIGFQSLKITASATTTTYYEKADGLRLLQGHA